MVTMIKDKWQGETQEEAESRNKAISKERKNDTQTSSFDVLDLLEVLIDILVWWNW